MVEVVLKERLCLLLIGVNKGFGNLFFKNLKILFVQGILQELEIALLNIVRKVTLFHHLNEGLPYRDGMNRVDLHIIRERVIERLHNKSG